MGNRTESTTVLAGGALVTVLLYFLGPELSAWRGPPSPEVVAGMTTVTIFALSWVLPGELLARVGRRTRPRSDSKRSP